MMKRREQRPVCMIAAAVLACCLTVTAFAAPSISDLQGQDETTTIIETGTDGTNTAEILSGEGIYTSEAVSAQYDNRLFLTDTIEFSRSTVSETGENGHTLAEKVPTVEEIIAFYCDAADEKTPADMELNLKDYDQITYWLDFKYGSTGYRVIAGETRTVNGRTEKLDNGMLEVEIDGGELIRAANMEDYLIIQIDAETGELHYLKMKSYDAETGKYTVDFPCIGPYMITQKISSK